MNRSSDNRLLSGLFLRLLPYQVLLIVINAVNGIVDSLNASYIIGKAAMSALGLFGPFNHFLYATSIVFASGSQMLYGRYLVKDRRRIHHLFTVTLLLSGTLALLTSVLLALGAVTGLTRILVSTEPELQMLNEYILGGQAVWYIRGKSEWKFSLCSCSWQNAPQIVRLGYPGALYPGLWRCTAA